MMIDKTGNIKRIKWGEERGNGRDGEERCGRGEERRGQKEEEIASL